MKSIRRISTAIISAAMLLNCGCASAEKNKDITVELDGKTITFDVDAQLIDGRTMVPLRRIFEEVGALVKWDEDTQTITARKGSKTISMTVNSSDMIIDKGKTDDEGNPVTETVMLDVPPQLVSDRTLVPVRAISEAFGLDVDWDEKTSTVYITSVNDGDDTWKSNTGTIDLSDMSADGNGISVNGNEIMITGGGDFTVTGKTESGNIVINSEDKVKLRLDNAEIHSEEKPCVYVESADKAYITISSGTENVFVSSCEDGAVYSKDDLEIKGGGSLDITSGAGHGIKASDDLTIEEGTISISAAKDGINVNDTFKMTGGAVKAEAVNDGIASDSIIIIDGGSLDIKTTLEPSNADELTAQDSNTDRPMGGFGQADAEFAVSAKGIKAGWMLVINGGDITVNSTDHCIHSADAAEINGGKTELSSLYGKGVSAHGDLTVNGEATVINVAKSTEGLESKDVLTINDGNIKIISSDDALNGTGGRSGIGGGMGRDMSGRQGERPGGRSDMPQDRDIQEMPPEPRGEIIPPDDMMPQEKKIPPEGMGRDLKDTLIINGGNIELTAYDDCLDANGNIIISGGTVKAVSPGGGIVNVTGVFDPDGTTTISEGARIIAAAPGGGSERLNVSQNAVTVYTDTSHDAGESITVYDKDGNVIGEYAPSGVFGAIFITMPELETGGSYTVSAGGETHEFEMTGGNITVGTAAAGMNGFGQGRGIKPQGERQRRGIAE